LIWKFVQTTARILATVLFDSKVYGRGNIPRRGGVLIVSNHQSYLDPVLMAVKLDRPLNYIAKSELFEGRWSSWILRTLNAFPVRQGAGDISAVKETIHRLQEGHLLNIYPEGQRTETGEIGELQKGVALIIRRAKVPIIPAAIVGSFEAWPIQRRWLQASPVKIKFGRPIELADMDSKEMIASIDHTLRTMYEELRNHSATK
jgi:1-acyl-sn-glycerol-3-phosphate acyltransferase